MTLKERAEAVLIEYCDVGFFGQDINTLYMKHGIYAKQFSEILQKNQWMMNIYLDVKYKDRSDVNMAVRQRFIRELFRSKVVSVTKTREWENGEWADRTEKRTVTDHVIPIAQSLNYLERHDPDNWGPKLVETIQQEIHFFRDYDSKRD